MGAQLATRGDHVQIIAYGTPSPGSRSPLHRSPHPDVPRSSLNIRMLCNFLQIMTETHSSISSNESER
ncbi:hypothetical protein NPIL_561951 [Nephila pilipes]|uniref:Uncharacterized protein n=1 Tax=Nephila pilipes TaxID=299642 RepID=A0A8X6NK58_NEPPI|nr:hypothetical protein NPIL_561951 [Nephila pilipes]